MADQFNQFRQRFHYYQHFAVAHRALHMYESMTSLFFFFAQCTMKSFMTFFLSTLIGFTTFKFA